MMNKSMKIASWWLNSGQTTSQIVSSFATRVTTDGGVVEAPDCLTSRVEQLKTLGLWDKASAIWMPHGYKEGKLYAVKGGANADLGFTRNGTRTRKGPQYVEQVPYNLVARSEDLDLGSWSKTNITVTANQVTAPDGTLLELVTCNSTNAVQHSIQQTVANTGGGIAAFSFLLKAGTQRYIQVTLGASTQVWFGGVIDTTTMTIVGGEGTLTLLGDGVYKYTRIGSTAIPATQASTMHFIANDTTTHWSSANPSDGNGTWYCGKVQVTWLSERDYFKTTDRFNVPALDYTNSTCPALSLEPARTNLLLQSGSFSNPWSNTDLFIATNDINGPSGLKTATKFTQGAAGQGTTRQSIIVAAGSVVAFSIFAKYSNHQWLDVQITSGAGNVIRGWFDIQNGVKGSSSVVGTTISGYDIINYGDGWYRCIVIGPLAGGATTYDLSVFTVAADGSTTRVTGSEVYLADAQAEVGSYATSYIPTTTATVTRIADTIPEKTGFTDYIGQTEGSWFVDWTPMPYEFDQEINLDDGTTANRIRFSISVGVSLIGVSFISSGSSFASVNVPIVYGNRYRILVSYKENEFKCHVNGLNILTDLSGLVPVGMSVVRFTHMTALSRITQGLIHEMFLLKSIPTDETAATLTTL